MISSLLIWKEVILMPLTIPPEKERAKLARNAIRDSFATDVHRRTGVRALYEYPFAKPERLWRSDIAWPDVKIALEIDGGTWNYGRHNRSSSILQDMEKGNGYSERNWIVFHTPWDWLKNMKKRAALLDQIVKAIQQRAHSFGVTL